MNKYDMEKVHTALFALHVDIYERSLGRVKAALTLLHKMELEGFEIRPTIRGYIQQLESLRETLENAGQDASAFRTHLIDEHGCDGRHG